MDDQKRPRHEDVVGQDASSPRVERSRRGCRARRRGSRSSEVAVKKLVCGSWRLSCASSVPEDRVGVEGRRVRGGARVDSIQRASWRRCAEKVSLRGRDLRGGVNDSGGSQSASTMASCQAPRRSTSRTIASQRGAVRRCRSASAAASSAREVGPLPQRCCQPRPRLSTRWRITWARVSLGLSSHARAAAGQAHAARYCGSGAGARGQERRCRRGRAGPAASARPRAAPSALGARPASMYRAVGEWKRGSRLGAEPVARSARAEVRRAHPKASAEGAGEPVNEP